MRVQAAILMGLVAGSQPASAQLLGDSLPIIDARGEASRVVTPDRATILFDVEGFGFELADATDSLMARVAAIEDALDALEPSLRAVPWGFRAATNPQQQRVFNPQMAPMRSNQDRVGLSGLQVTIEDVNRLPEVVSALSDAGVRQIAGVLYENSRAQDVQSELFVEAVQRARVQAEAIARGLGGTLGPIISAGPERGGFDQTFNQVVQGASLGGAQIMLRPVDLRIVAAVQTRWRFVPN